MKNSVSFWSSQESHEVGKVKDKGTKISKDVDNCCLQLRSQTQLVDWEML